MALWSVWPKFIPIGMMRGFPVLRAVLCSASVIAPFAQSTSLISTPPGRILRSWKQLLGIKRLLGAPEDVIGLKILGSKRNQLGNRN